MTQPPKPVAGDWELVDWLNAERQCTLERTPLDSASCKIETTPKGFRVHSAVVKGAGSGEVERFRIYREYKDYVVGVRWTPNLTSDVRGIVGTNGSDEVRIAKPFELQASTFDVIARGGVGTGPVDGYFYSYSETVGLRTRTLDNASAFGADSITWTETIFPPYLFDVAPATQPDHRIIVAAKVKQGPLMRVIETVAGAPTSFDINYMDMNSDGRVWKPADKKIKVCVEGENGGWFALFPASDAFQEEE